MKDYELGTASAAALGKILVKNDSFARLALCSVKLGDAGLTILTKYLKKTLSLVHIDVSNNDLTGNSLNEFLLMVGKHQTIVSVNVSSSEGYVRNRLRLNSGPSLELALKSPILSILNLSGTGITSESIPYLTAGLKGNRTLIDLDVSHNEIGHKNFQVFFDAVLCSGIFKLNIGYNSLGDKGGIAMEASFEL